MIFLLIDYFSISHFDSSDINIFLFNCDFLNSIRFYLRICFQNSIIFTIFHQILSTCMFPKAQDDSSSSVALQLFLLAVHHTQVIDFPENVKVDIYIFTILVELVFSQYWYSWYFHNTGRAGFYKEDFINEDVFRIKKSVRCFCPSNTSHASIGGRLVFIFSSIGDLVTH